jgi:hypothetical protein
MNKVLIPPRISSLPMALVIRSRAACITSNIAPLKVFFPGLEAALLLDK